jgi:hypothetical protein
MSMTECDSKLATHTEIHRLAFGQMAYISVYACLYLIIYYMIQGATFYVSWMLRNGKSAGGQ